MTSKAISVLSLLLCAVVLLSACSKANSSSAVSGADSSSSSSPSASSAPSESSSSGSSSQSSSWNLILVNPDNPLPEGYNPPIANYTSDRQFDERALPYLKQMVEAAKKDGIKLYITSAYRPYSTQVALFNNKVNTFLSKGYSKDQATAEAAKIVAVPGTSEHNLGLAADIVSNNWYSTHSELTEDFDQTPEFKWLYANCAKYGFILRYPKDKQAITKIVYEPWHYRYVGAEDAQKIMAAGLCLEEYLGKTK